EPARPQRLEVAGQDHSLLAREARPFRWSHLDAEPPGSRDKLCCVLVDRPAAAVAHHEQPRGRLPPPRPYGDEASQTRVRNQSAGASGHPPRDHPSSTRRYRSATSASSGTRIASRRSSSSLASRSSTSS